MQREFYIVVALIAAIASATPALADPKVGSVDKDGFKFLSAKEVKKLLSGSSLSSTSSRGSPVEAWYREDSTYEGYIDNRTSIGGKWWTEEPSTYCTQSTTHSRPKRCWNVWFNGRNKLKFVGPEGLLRATIKK